VFAFASRERTAASADSSAGRRAGYGADASVLLKAREHPASLFAGGGDRRPLRVKAEATACLFSSRDTHIANRDYRRRHGSWLATGSTSKPSLFSRYPAWCSGRSPIAPRRSPANVGSLPLEAHRALLNGHCGTGSRRRSSVTVITNSSKVSSTASRMSRRPSSSVCSQARRVALSGQRAYASQVPSSTRWRREP
jgi:hypothetical protein